VGTTTTRFIAVAITVVWSVSICAAIFIPGYAPPIEIHAIMGLVAGGLFGREAVVKLAERATNGGGHGSD
jgi:hypothetical protein